MNERTTIPGRLKRILLLADKIVRRAIIWLSILCFAGLFLLVLANVLIRINPIKELKVSLHFFEEIQVWFQVAMIFYGAAGLWILRDHFKLDVLKNILYERNPKAHAFFNLFVELASVFFIGIFTYQCYVFGSRLLGETNFLRIPEKTVYLSSMFVPGAIMCVYSVRNLAVCGRDLFLAFKRSSREGGAGPAERA